MIRELNRICGRLYRATLGPAVKDASHFVRQVPAAFEDPLLKSARNDRIIEALDFGHPTHNNHTAQLAEKIKNGLLQQGPGL